MIPDGGAGHDALRIARRRRALSWLNLSLMTLLMAALLVFVNLISHTRYARIDMTADKVWEISAESRQIIKSVTRPLEIFLNMVAEGPMAQPDRSLGEAWRRTQQLLIELSGQSSNIRVYPVMEGSQAFAAVMKQFSRPEPNTLYFVYRTVDDKPLGRAVPLSELYRGNSSTGEVLDYFGEGRIVTTIAQLVSDRKLKIYHTIGHREVPPSASDRNGLSVIASRLMALENADFKPLDLAKDRAVPEDADLVLVAMPTTDFTTVETDALKAYWARGGRLFVAVHPLVPDPLDEFRKGLESFGIRINRDLVLDQERQTGRPNLLAVTSFMPHPSNQGMPGSTFLVLSSCSVDAAPVNRRMQARPLFLSSPNTWGETDLSPRAEPKHGPGERWGNVPLAAAAEEMGSTEKASRIIVWGSFATLTNDLNLVRDVPNDYTLTYITNNFRWLLEREVLIAKPEGSRKPRMKPFAPPPGAFAVIGWISIAGVPLLGVALGGLAWYFRRK